MTARAAARFAAHVGGVHFVRDYTRVGPAIQDRLARLGVAAAVPAGVAGGYVKGSGGTPGEVVIDGGVPVVGRAAGMHAAGVYAHEFMHAVDGPGDELSRSPGWVRAWAAEVHAAAAPPSEYARESPAEGLAEFGRLVFLNPNAARRLYPACWRQFEREGLV
jgi:hypothetical protein